MVAIDTTASRLPSIVGRFVSSVYRAAALVQGWNDARVTRAALSRLSSRELDDIGLCYGDIDAIADRSYR